MMPLGQGNKGGGHRAPAWIVLAGVMLLGLPACNFLDSGPAFDQFITVGGVTLRLENQSGLDISAEVVFLEGDSLVRRTDRLLPASGIESSQEIIPTYADSVIVTARLADSAIAPSGLSAGAVIQMASYLRGVDYESDETITFIVAALPSPNPVPDCNGDCPIFGDLNNDGVVDQIDVPLFIAVMLRQNQDPAAIRKSDFNLDGVANGLDLQGFTTCLAGGK